MTPPAPLAGALRTLADLAGIRGESAATADRRCAAAAAGAVTPEAAVTAARAGVPALLRHLLERSAITSGEAVTLVRRIGILTLADLHAALDDGRVKQLAGEAVDTRLRDAAGALELDIPPVSLGRALGSLEPLVTAISAACPALDLITIAGDVRRFEPMVSSAILVGRAPDPPSAIDALCALRGVDDVLHRSGRRAILLIRESEIDIRVASPDEYGTVLFLATGSRAHVHAMHQRRGRARISGREEDVYMHAGLAFIAPELRHGSGEIEAAAAGTLPTLVAREHIRGDLHMHTTYSDGADALDAMVAQACALGYEYIAITDHSERAAASRTLTRADLARQRDEIAGIRRRYPQIAILHGVEVDIMPDGRLDFPDAVLEPLDIVLASLHDAARQDAKTLTRRCIQAIRHPLVTILTHPANQFVGHRAGFALDFEAVYAAAAETGTALEVDGAPAHLDLDGEHARAAVSAGVTLTIDSDGHRARLLDLQMRLGIGTARRGWVDPQRVLNARPLADVRTFIAAKRGGR